jgi:hypothetical protein
MGRQSWRWYFLLGSLAAVPIVVIPDSWWYTAWYDTLGLSAVFAVLVGARRNRTRAPSTWRWLAAGQLLFVAGDFLFDLNERVWNTDAFPSAADGFYLGGYLPLAIGLTMLIRARTPGKDRAGVIDATIVATGFGLLAWTFLMAPAAGDSSLSILGRVIALAYPAADVLLLALLARLLVSAGAHNAAFRLLAASLVALLVADVGYAVLSQADTYTPNHPINIGWLLSYVLFGAAALHPAMAGLSERATEPPRRLTRRRLSILTAVSLLAPLLLLFQAWQRTTVDAPPDRGRVDRAVPPGRDPHVRADPPGRATGR